MDQNMIFNKTDTADKTYKADKADMTGRIVSILEGEGVCTYIIRNVCESRVEMYLVGERTDIMRSSDTDDYSVSVYCDFTVDGEQNRGCADVRIFGSMTDEEISSRIRAAMRAARLSPAPYYPLAAAMTERADDTSPDIYRICEGYRRALCEHGTLEGAFINSAELFCSHKRTRIVSSEGLDVCSAVTECTGELVVGCREGEDVELFDYFRYEGEQYELLGERAGRLLASVRDRSRAEKCVRTGRYDIILEGECVRELLGYVLWLSDNKNIHTGYSSASVGAPVAGDLPDIEGIPTLGFSREGVRMIPRMILADGILVSCTGDVRFSHYRSAEPTGHYERIRASVRPHQRVMPLAQLEEELCIHIVSFSDFQFDPYDGYFGGEVRLGYLCRDGHRTPVTGLSVSGYFGENCTSMCYSSERHTDYTYDGPLAVRIGGVTVSGISEAQCDNGGSQDE